MPVFGTLADMPIADVAEFAARRGGLLRLTPPGGGPEVLLLFEGQVVRCAALAEGGRPLTGLTRDQLEGRLLALSRRPETQFRLESGKTIPCQPPINVPVQALLLSIVQTMDEYEAHKDHLPHPLTRFRLSGGLGAVEGALRAFAHRAEPLLRQGATPKEIAQALNLPLGQVRYYLYKLQMLGATEVMEVAEPPPPQERQERRSLASRLLGFLRRRWAR